MTEEGSGIGHELPADLASALRADASERSERDDIFWTGQRARIRSRIRARVQQRHPMRVAFAGAVILFLAVLLTAPAGRSPQVMAPPAAEVDADQELLIAVERALASGTPQSLAPLTPFAEPGSNLDERQTIPHKEHGNEE